MQRVIISKWNTADRFQARWNIFHVIVLSMFRVNSSGGWNVWSDRGMVLLSETPVSDGSVEASNVDAARFVSRLCIVGVQHEHNAVAKYWLASRRT